MDFTANFPKKFPEQHQNIQPGIEKEMNPTPIFKSEGYGIINGKLKDKVAVITGGDSGIGKAAAIALANEGADIAIIYNNENKDAEDTKKEIEKAGRKCVLIAGDIKIKDFCNKAIEKVISSLGKINILINNAVVQYEQQNIEDITEEQLKKTFETNIFGTFFMTQAAIAHLQKGDSIINTTSITAYRGHETLIDYSSTKGALTSFTRSLAMNLVSKGIRVNAVAPGPVWTPLIPASFDEKKVGNFGTDNKQGRAAQPVELAGAYVFLASQEASFITGTTIHVNGGDMVMS
ncbi:SDR family oxidoreductase [Clostridium intestinale]|uniref:SDR family oxidoreductase n=1 Tax=Clostridium intestinale TaxID=36845 RepID=A0A7D6ZU22_9CLOT|nr:SDR family oxidoreductase [Clostridium intestinale]QLY79733.1 SDR family oxidoreductase [Clostridium intestinale]